MDEISSDAITLVFKLICPLLQFCGTLVLSLKWTCSHDQTIRGQARSGQDRIRQVKALDTTLANLTKRFGDGAIMRLAKPRTSRLKPSPPARSRSTWRWAWAASRAGASRGLWAGSAGKTTLCQHIIAEAQKLGGTCAFIDMEHALDPTYAARCGVNIDDLYIAQPDTGDRRSKSPKP